MSAFTGNKGAKSKAELIFFTEYFKILWTVIPKEFVNSSWIQRLALIKKRFPGTDWKQKLVFEKNRRELLAFAPITWWFHAWNLMNSACTDPLSAQRMPIYWNTRYFREHFLFVFSSCLKLFYFVINRSLRNCEDDSLAWCQIFYWRYDTLRLMSLQINVSSFTQSKTMSMGVIMSS